VTQRLRGRNTTAVQKRIKASSVTPAAARSSAPRRDAPTQCRRDVLLQQIHNPQQIDRLRGLAIAPPGDGGANDSVNATSGDLRQIILAAMHLRPAFSSAPILPATSSGVPLALKVETISSLPLALPELGHCAPTPPSAPRSPRQTLPAMNRLRVIVRAGQSMQSFFEMSRLQRAYPMLCT